MFEFAVLRRTGNSQEIVDIGLLAETLLFYQRIHILLDSATFSYLLKNLGGEALLALCKRPGITASFSRENLATVTTNIGGVSCHTFAEVGFHGTKAGKRTPDGEWIDLQISWTLGSNMHARRLSKKFQTAVPFSSWRSLAINGRDVPSLAREDLKDERFADLAIKSVLKELMPSFELPQQWYFRTISVGEQFLIDTNFNFDELNRHYHTIIPPSHSSLTQAYLVNHLLEARGGILLGSKHMAELVVDPVSAKIIKLKCVELISKRERQAREIDLFQEQHLQDGRKIREAINSGERNFGEFLKVLDEAQKFKSWLADRNPDQQLATEYFLAATKESWVDKLPSKSMRWAISTGLAAAIEAMYPTGAAAVASQGLSLADATLLDKLLKGWKPNHFGQNTLGPFVSGDI